MYLKPQTSKIILFCIFLVTTFSVFSQTSPTTFYSANNGTATNEFTVPAGITQLTVETWGAGGKGGSATINGTQSGGGGGGAYATSVINVTAGETYTIYAGNGATTTANGENSYIYLVLGTNLVEAGGGQSVTDDNSTGGSGGVVILGTGFSGGAGGNGVGPPTKTGGGGGSSAGTTSIGTNGTTLGGIAPAGGGNGGNGGGEGINGSNGFSPGGGGGGASKKNSGTLIGGNGADGQVTISWSLPAPEINLVGNGTNIPSGNTAISTLDDTDFGTVDIASGSNSHIFTIENLGSVNLTLDNLSPYVVLTGDTADFTLTAAPTTPISYPSGSTTFTITFDPITTGTKSATISIANNDTTGGEDPYTFNIEGVGFDFSSLCGATVSTFPYTEDFETGIGNWVQDTGDDFDWTRQTGGTATTDTGPSSAAIDSFYMYTEATGFTSSTANIESPCFDLTGTINPRATFFYHMFGAYIDFADATNNINYLGTLNVDISTDGGVTYPTNLWTYTGYIQVDELSSWIPLSFDLSAYIGQTVKFRIQGITDTDSRSDIAIDNFTVTDKVNPSFAPGGVTSDLSIWLKSNDGHSYTDGQNVSLWQDQGVASDLKTHKSGQEPTYKDNVSSNVNFNPVIEFDNPYASFSEDLDYSHDLTTNSQFLTGDYGLFTQEMFIVLIPDDTPITFDFGFMDVYCADSNLTKDEADATGIGFGEFSGRIDNEIISYAHSTYSKNEPGDGYAVSEIGTGSSYTNVGIINTRNHATLAQQELYYNANDIETDQNDIAEFENSNDTRFWLGRSEGWESSLNARVVEVISYSTRKSDTDLTQERNRIQSYLAIKYGITLGVNGTSQDYVDSDGTIIWDVDTGSVLGEDVFNYNITGIGRDDVSELNQKQSKTVNTTDDITIGLIDINTTNNLNTNTFTADKTFLVWGNDDATLTGQPAVVVDMSEGILPLGSLATDVEFTPMGRKWKVAAKGTNFSAKVSIPETLLIPLGPPPGDYLMFVSDSPTFSPTSEYRIMSSDGLGNFQTNYTFSTTKYITFGFAPEKTFVRSINFDGIIDYLDAGDVLDLNTTTTEFTISAWIKRENTAASIVSKGNNGFTIGYNFGINGSGNLEMSWNGGSETITSSVPIPASKWHHVAVIYDGTTAKLYIDGVEDVTQTTALAAAIDNSESFLIAAADGDEVNTTSFFEGNIDEVRIWDVALTEDQLRFVINQEIKDNTNVDGSYFASLGITPTKNDISVVPWANLKGYYPMSTYTFTNCKDASGNGNTAALKNLNTVDYQTAPLPYVSDADGAWDTPTTWLNNTVQNLPNSLSIIDGATRIDWNIVEISDNNIITSGASRNISILGLNMISNTADGTDTELTINGDTATGTGNGLTITHYLKLDGVLDLQGESQLIQTTDSDFDAASTGYLERDQQGEGNLYRYNYWSSPVYTGNDGNNYATVGAALKDGTTPAAPVPASFTGSYDGLEGPPITLSTVWMYKYANKSGAYSEWVHVGSSGTIYSGEGFTMKGTKAPGGTSQNYVFEGKPNNGTITLNVADTNSYLVGNPYPSALDAHQFLFDNSPPSINPLGTNSIRGELYFWEHYGGDSHNLKEYQGGYATLNLSSSVGVPAASGGHADVSNLGTATKTPVRYIPIGQSFYVVGDNTVVGAIEFNNGQRTFMKEGGTTSVFMKSSSKKSKIVTANKTDLRPKFRIGFDAPKISHRQLLLTIDENTSDALDWGYDAKIFGTIKDDMYWMIDDKKYVIQATNTLTLDKEIPLGIQTEEGGLISIMIDALENAEENTSIYIKDKLNGETYDITNQAFEINLEAGEYLERFVLTFQPRLKTLEEVALVEGVHIFMNNTISELQVNKIVDTEIVNVNLFNYLGQQVNTWNINTDERFVSLPIQIATGVYIVQVNTTAGVITKKVIIE